MSNAQTTLHSLQLHPFFLKKRKNCYFLSILLVGSFILTHFFVFQFFLFKVEEKWTPTQCKDVVCDWLESTLSGIQCSARSQDHLSCCPHVRSFAWHSKWECSTKLERGARVHVLRRPMLRSYRVILHLGRVVATLDDCKPSSTSGRLFKCTYYKL